MIVWAQTGHREHAEIRIGEGGARGDGMLTRAGRPPAGAAVKQQVALRLDPEVIARFRESGPGWQSRINAALRKAVGL